MFAKGDLADKIAEYREPYHSISLTGGEPLLQAVFIKDFLREYKDKLRKPIYLETNGTLHGALSELIDLVDIIAMDFKLPSSTSGQSLWKEHEKFLKIACNKKVFIKAVITSGTTLNDVEKMAGIVARTDPGIPLVLQPVTASEGIERPDEEALKLFTRTVRAKVRHPAIVPQTHKLIGIK